MEVDFRALNNPTPPRHTRAVDPAASSTSTGQRRGNPSDLASGHEAPTGQRASRPVSRKDSGGEVGPGSKAGRFIAAGVGPVVGFIVLLVISVAAACYFWTAASSRGDFWLGVGWIVAIALVLVAVAGLVIGEMLSAIATPDNEGIVDGGVYGDDASSVKH